jgi:hypothetical protein
MAVPTSKAHVNVVVPNVDVQDTRHYLHVTGAEPYTPLDRIAAAFVAGQRLVPDYAALLLNGTKQLTYVERFYRYVRIDGKGTGKKILRTLLLFTVLLPALHYSHKLILYVRGNLYIYQLIRRDQAKNPDPKNISWAITPEGAKADPKDLGQLLSPELVEVAQRIRALIKRLQNNPSESPTKYDQGRFVTHSLDYIEKQYPEDPTRHVYIMRYFKQQLSEFSSL